jgi:nitronate monooxygenase
MLPSLVVRGRELRIPVVQGGMGVGISRHRLAGAVAEAGGMGTLAAQGLGQTSTLPPPPGTVRLRKRDDPHGWDVLTAETRAARDRAGDRGIVAVNVMVAITHYARLVRAALDGGAQAIVSGAGVPLDLPAIVGSADVALIPIVSSVRALRLLCRHWKELHGGRLPDAVVVEGPLAGGHLGFRREALSLPENQLEALVPAIVEEARRWGDFPVIAAGGLWDHADAQRMIALGAAGVQLGTRFVVTDECDVDEGYKRLLLRIDKNDITIVDSPVGMPARVVRTPLIERFERGDYPGFKCHYQCLETCVAEKVHYCIADHLVDAARGLPHGFYFVGANGWRCREVLPVAEVMRRLREGEPPPPTAPAS